MKQEQKISYIENIKNSIKLLDDNTGTKLKETILDDLTLLEPHLKEAPKSVMQIALQESLKLQAHYGGPKSQDSFGAKIGQNSTVRENRFYLPVYTCAGV
jgi:hypothetical protein